MVLSVAFYVLSPSQVERIANHFLGQQISLEMKEKPQMSATETTIPSLVFKLNQPTACPLVSLQNVRMQWWHSRTLDVEKAVFDYACLTQMQTQENAKTELNLTALLAALPNADIHLHSIKFIHTDDVSSPALAQLLQAEMAAKLSLNQQKLMLEAQGKTDLNEPESAVLFQLNSVLDKQQLTTKLSYLPQQEQQYLLNVDTHLADNLYDLPTQGQVNLQWENPELALKQGALALQWQDQKGTATLQDLAQQQQIFHLPFSLDNEKLQIEKGNFYWDIAALEQPLQGVLNLSLHKSDGNWLPLRTDLRVSLFSSGEEGKGNIVIYGKDGLISQESVLIPLEAHGNVKYDKAIAYADIVFDIAGDFNDIFVSFKPTSMLRVNWKEPEANMNVGLPLAGIRVGRYGVNGRLQAILKGYTAQFNDIDLRLDGWSNEFIAGIKSLFAIRAADPLIKNVEQTATNLWQWKFWGKAKVKALNTDLKLNGRGAWRADRVEVSELTATTAKIHTAGVYIPQISVELKDKLRWHYAENKIRGLLQAKAAEIKLDYGGRFIQPVFGLGLDGTHIKDFNLAGDVKAGELGPIKLFAHYRQNELVGNIYWLEQSAKVFQSLFPQNWQWIIQKGTIRGQTAFDISAERGLQMGGHFAIRQGEITLPNGELRGIEFALPYRYVNKGLELVKNPIQVSVKHLKMGVLEAENLSVKVQGYYPYSKNKPLTLSELKLNLLGGEVSVNKFALPQRQIANVQLRRIDLSQALAMAQYTQLGMQGRVNAVFPFWLTHSRCIICDGKIEKAADEDVRFSLGDKLLDGLKSGGLTEGILADVVSEMDLQALSATVNLAPNGILDLAANIRGYNPKKKSHNPITLNYNHQENVYELWKMLDYGSKFEQKLEYELYQKLNQ
ncbi:hypothetical protein A4G18_02120 [Pasteurellaceae bacterium Pebbles2]|nr:hypothetical protein [Pasteurellaceae bacterium Pebbles2]